MSRWRWVWNKLFRVRIEMFGVWFAGSGIRTYSVSRVKRIYWSLVVRKLEASEEDKVN